MQENMFDAQITALQSLEDEQLCSAIRPLTIDDEDIPGFRMKVVEDTEVEYFFTESGLEPDEYGFPVWKKEVFPTWINNNSAYFTSSGNEEKFDGRCQTEKNDDCCRLTEEIQPWKKEYYSSAKPTPAQVKMYLMWEAAVIKYSGNQTKLRKLWKVFWKTYHRYSNQERKNWMWRKHISRIVARFNWYGIRSKRS